jgi:hypothetical protein
MRASRSLVLALVAACVACTASQEAGSSGARGVDAGGDGPLPTVVASTPATKCDVAVLGPLVVWSDADHGLLDAANVDRGMPQTTPFLVALVGPEVRPHAIAARDNGLFWLAGATPALRRQKAFDAPETLAAPAAGIIGFAATKDASSAYFITGDNTVQMTGAAATDPPVVVAIEPDGAKISALALDESTLVVAVEPGGPVEPGGVDVISLAPSVVAHCGDVDPSTGSPTFTRCKRISSVPNPRSLVVGDGNAYWIDGGLVGKNDVAAGTSYTTLALYDPPPTTIAYANRGVYVATPNKIERLETTPGAPRTAIAVTPDPPVSMAVDSWGAFWSAPDCRILTAAP